MSYENATPEELRSALAEREQQLKDALTEVSKLKAILALWDAAFPDTDLHPKQIADEITKLEGQVKTACDILGKRTADYEQIVKENAQLNRALELRLDAMPSGLSAGQAKALEGHTRTLYDLLKSARSHIPDSAMAGSISAEHQRSFDSARTAISYF